MPPPASQARSRFASLRGSGLPAGRLEALAGRLGLPLWRDGDRNGNGDGAGGGDGTDAPVLLVFTVPPDIRDAGCWAPPVAAWIEAGDLEDAALAGLAGRATAADLFVSVTTATANTLQLARHLVQALAARHPLPEERGSDIEFALHEAVSNAVVHGNLQVQGMKGLTVEALERFSQDLADRLADPALARRRVEVGLRLAGETLWIEVADEGEGFLPAAPDAPAPPGRIAGCESSGRGLDLIGSVVRSLRLLDGGRRIRMEFAL